MTYFWFRRDLRLYDNAGLYHALKENDNVQTVFIFDQNILDELKDRSDPRVSFIHQEVKRLKNELVQMGSDLLVFYGKPLEIWETIINSDSDSTKVVTNEDYEPYALHRDHEIEAILNIQGGSFEKYKDHLIFAKNEILKKDGKPYTVFTPYKRKWLEKLNSYNRSKESNSYYFKSYPTAHYKRNYHVINKPSQMISLQEMNFKRTELSFPVRQASQETIKKYDVQRDFPGINGTSRLGIHYRFGTVSIREKARKSYILNQTYLSELIWRDFYAQILYHFPEVETHAFRKKYDRIPWRNDEHEFKQWCLGKTGYPLVDAGMRELNQTGYMHNRVRMVVASFLTKHLLIDWRKGEAYFAEKLLDFDLASNNGGWQWAAGCGTDAAPYFRIFNPSSQLQKFDRELEYVMKWVPEFGSPDYPQPIVDHKFARERCLETYKRAIS